MMQIDLPEIIQKIKEGDKSAFRLLLEKYQQKAFNLAFRMLGDEDEARDVVQETFIKIWEKRNTYNNNENFTNWMYKIVNNKCIDMLRTRKRRPSVPLNDYVEGMFQNNEYGNDKALENKEAGQLIKILCEKLPPRQCMVFTMRDLQGLSVSEVIKITGLTETVIKSNLHHARKTIRGKLMLVMNYENKTL